MKIIKNELLKAVKVCNTIKNDLSIPLWDSLLFQCLNGEIIITGRSQTKIIQHRIKDEAGSTIEPFLFNGKLMAKLLKECPDDLVTITNDDHRISISIGNSKFDLSHRATDALEYIKCFPDCGEQKASASIPAYYIRDYANAWDTFSSKDELRPVMSYICLELTDGAGYLVVTNAHILFRVKFEWYTEDPQTFLLPSRDIGKLCKLLPKEDLQITKYKDWAKMVVGSTSLLYYNLNDKYPNWQAVVPAVGDKIVFNAKELMETVRQVHLLSNSSTHQIILNSNDDGTYIHAHDFDFDNHATVQIKAFRKGDNIDIGFNSRLLQECLKEVKGTTVTMEYTAANRAVVFTGDASAEVLVLLMPVMIQ